MRRLTLLVLLLAAATLPGRLLAHDSHEHKVMGSVTAISASQIEVETTDGTKVAIPLTPETKYLQGKTAVAATEIEIGERVVVIFTEEDGKKIAKRVRLASAGGETGAARTP